MTDKNQIREQVEELLGSEGSPEMAEALVATLESHGYITFDGQYGYELALPDWNDDGQCWNELLAEAEA
jgi:hypothetical protein